MHTFIHRAGTSFVDVVFHTPNAAEKFVVLFTVRSRSRACEWVNYLNGGSGPQPCQYEE